MSRLTKKIEDGLYTAPNIPNTDVLKYKLGKLEDLLEKYNVNSIEKLDEILRIYFMRGDKK